MVFPRSKRSENLFNTSIIPTPLTVDVNPLYVQVRQNIPLSHTYNEIITSGIINI